MRALAGALAVVALAAGCSFGGTETTTVIKTVSTEQPVSTEPTQRCRSDALGFEISYPRGWYAHQTCLFFDPKPFTVPENSDFSGTAMEIVVPQQPLDVILDGYDDIQFWRGTTLRQTTVRGRPATILETEATGAGLYEKGTRFYVYGFDRDEVPPVLVQTSRPPGQEWGSRKTVVDRAVQTLRFF